MGYTSKGERVGGKLERTMPLRFNKILYLSKKKKLERTIRTPYCFGSVEVGSFVFNVVYLERAEDVVPFPLHMDSSVQ